MLQATFPVIMRVRLLGRAKLELRYTGCDIQPLRRFAAKRLKTEILGGTADQRIGPQTNTDGCTGCGPDIATRKRALARTIGREIVDDPAKIGFLGYADIDTEFADTADISLTRAGTLDEITLNGLAGSDDHADATGDLAG